MTFGFLWGGTYRGRKCGRFDSAKPIGIHLQRHIGRVIMEQWRKTWREGFAPNLSTAGLQALLQALQENSPELTQGATTVPPPLECVKDCPVEAACLLGYCGWKGEALTSVREVEEFFAQRCCEADKIIGEPAVCRWLLNWFGDTPREEMRRELIPEVKRELSQREQIAA